MITNEQASIVIDVVTSLIDQVNWQNWVATFGESNSWTAQEVHEAFQGLATQAHQDNPMQVEDLEG